MGEWKACFTLRIRPNLRLELEQFAPREQRSLGNIGAVLLEWSFQQLKAAGSIDRLLRYGPVCRLTSTLSENCRSAALSYGKRNRIPGNATRWWLFVF